MLTTLKPAAGNVDGNGNLLRNDTDMPIVLEKFSIKLNEMQKVEGESHAPGYYTTRKYNDAPGGGGAIDKDNRDRIRAGLPPLFAWCKGIDEKNSQYRESFVTSKKKVVALAMQGIDNANDRRKLDQRVDAGDLDAASAEGIDTNPPIAN